MAKEEASPRRREEHDAAEKEEEEEEGEGSQSSAGYEQIVPDSSALPAHRPGSRPKLKTEKSKSTKSLSGEEGAKDKERKVNLLITTRTPNRVSLIQTSSFTNSG
jgi:hypothetical protein